MKQRSDGQNSKKFVHRIVASIGVIMMMFTNTYAAASFKLKQPTHYFADEKTLALLQAAMAGDLPQARHLVEKGANPNDEGPRSNPYNRLRLLHYAMAANNREAVRILIAVGADPELNAQGFGMSYLFAITLRNMEMLSLLLDVKPINTLSKDTLEYVLFDSVRESCRDCLRLFLDRGAPIDFPDGAGYTMMMAAMDVQDYDLAEWLLLNGASVHVEAKGGVTPAYSVEFHLKKYRSGRRTYNKVLHLKELMQARGAHFPALSPVEVRARRAKR